MPVISAPHEFNVDDLFVDLRPIFGRDLFLKCEGFNFAGSIKIKAAAEMVTIAERSGRLRPGMTLVESSSGNLGVALGIIAAHRGYRFICVTDVRCNPLTRRLMTTLGADVRVVGEPAADEGLLGARIRYVQQLCAADDNHVWLNQYVNRANWQAHYRTTAPAIAAQFPDLDVLFIGAGTTGTLMGCARYFKAYHPGVRVVAVDSVGSVNFGGPAGRRMIPGLGTSVRPAILAESFVDDVVYVEEPETVRTCRQLLGHGFLLGGSTGTVISGALSWLADRSLRAVAISPDLGERYLASVYDDVWVRETYGDVLRDGESDLCLASPAIVV
ncbi:2,3-diaminopropionate biosynthesis protein SbnA [Micromonospora sp. WMMD734]|uniref:2,3-diaminopropionate biosynthesis protein SbnA n=1 Tax=Micromonospora sp. WMMD734 TaxID=3404129 RepID=UPI003B93DD56